MSDVKATSPIPTIQTPTSPVPNKTTKIENGQELMDFPKAIEHIIDGKKIHKLEWVDEENYGILKDGILMLHKPDGKFYQWIISDGDLVGTDWVVI